MLKGKKIYTVQSGRSYYLLQIKDFAPYVDIEFKKEDLNNWVYCNKEEGVTPYKYKELKQALIRIEINNDSELQKRLLFKDLTFLRERYIQIKDKVEIFISKNY